MHIIDVAVLYPHCPIGLDRHHQKDTDSLRCAGVFQGLSSRLFLCMCVLCLLQFRFCSFSCMRVLPDT